MNPLARRVQVVACIVVVAVLGAAAQTAAPVTTSSPASPWLLFTQVQAESNRIGQAVVWSNSLGYRLTPRLTAMAGVPYYYFSLAHGAGHDAGFGDAFVALQLASQPGWARILSTLTVTAPTGSRSAGLSSGRATVALDNRFNHSFGQWVPFADIGVANTIVNEAYLVQPVTTFGWVGQFQAGTQYYLTHSVAVGAAGYDIAPFGSQSVINRSTGAGSQSGSSSLDQDHGLGLWLNAAPVSGLLLQLSYARSQHDDTNTVGLTVGYDLLSPWRH